MIPDRIYIIGYMCSGKSSISRKVAARLGYEAYDTDDMFEEKYHICVQDFFDKYGEDYFRKFESEILKKTGELHHIVVQHYNSRLPIYEQSLITVKGEDVNIDEIIQKLTELE